MKFGRRVVTMAMTIAILASDCALAPQAARAQSEALPAAEAAYVEAVDNREFATALRIAETQIANPTFPRDRQYLASIRSWAIGALTAVVAQEGFDPSTDEKVERYHREALGYARGSGSGDRWMRSALDTGRLGYYASTLRPGMALPIAFRVLENVERGERVRDANTGQDVTRNDRRNIFKIIAALYVQMGRTADAAHYYELLLDEWRRASPASSSVRDRVQHRITYGEEIESVASFYADHDPSQLERLLQLARQIFADDRSYYPNFVLMSFAQSFAAAGQRARAEEIYNEAARGFRAANRSAITAEHTCTAAAIFAEAGRADTRNQLRHCETNFTPNSSAAAIGGIGDLYERIGDDAEANRLYDMAIRRRETQRNSYTVEERITLFNGPARRPYHGQARVRARAAIANPQSLDAFLEALAAAENVRGRQYGELTNTGSDNNVRRLAEIVRATPADEAVVSFTSTDRGLIVAAFDARQFRLALLPISTSELQASVQSTLALISGPQSNEVAAERALRDLSARVLRPAHDVLVGKSRITFIPDAALGLLPLGLLYSSDQETLPLGLRADVCVSPALRTLRFDNTATGPGAFLGVGDATFPQYLTPTGSNATLSVARTRTVGRIPNDRGRVEISALPETRSEVSEIGATFQASTLLLGPEASEQQLRTQNYAGIGYLHIATHGVLGGELPGLTEPALILAAQRNGDALLTASEVQRLDLSSVRLTVLSACNTGSGDLLTGEGVMGLSRAFLLAGSRNVLASLWPVDSAATEEFMIAYYENLLSGAAPDTALRTTMIAMRANHLHPYYWAPFVLVRR